MLLCWNPMCKRISGNKWLLWMLLSDHSSPLWELSVESEATNWRSKHGQTLSPGLLSCLVSVPCAGSFLMQPRSTCLWILSPSVEEPFHINHQHSLTQIEQPANMKKAHPQLRPVQMTVALEYWNVDSFTSLLTTSRCGLLRLCLPANLLS